MKARLASSYQKTFRRPLLRLFLLILGAPLTLAVWFSMLAKRSHLEALTRPLEEDSRGKDLEKAHRQSSTTVSAIEGVSSERAKILLRLKPSWTGR